MASRRLIGFVNSVRSMLSGHRSLAVALSLAVVLAVSAEMSPAAAQSCSTSTILAGPATEDTPKIHSSEIRGQTFVSPVSNCLTQITLQMCKDGPPTQNLVVELRDTSAGLPGTNVLGTAQIAPGDVASTCAGGSNPRVFSPVTAVFSSAPSITSGTLYALVFHQASSGGDGSHYYRIGALGGNPLPTGAFCNSLEDCPYGGGGGGIKDAPLAICTTACCTGCTLTQGYWKNHYPTDWPTSVVNSGMTLGTVLYTAANLDSIMGTPVGGNGLISLAHQLIAAKLNQANGACVPLSVSGAIAAADALIGGLVVPPVGSGSLAPSVTSALTTTLDTYNNGLTPGGPPHCGI